jgi:hypothetical protein
MSVDERSNLPASGHWVTALCSQAIVDFCVSLGNAVWSAVLLKEQSIYAAQLLFVCLTSSGHLCCWTQQMSTR